MTDYTTDAAAVASAMNAVYENKQTNKKNSISGDFSSDNESYPTVKAAKAEFGTKVTSWSGTTSDTNYPSEKLVKDSLDNKISKSQTSGLMKNDGTVDTSTYLTSSSISGKEDTSNKVTSWTSTTTDTHYPSEKLVKDSLDGKADSTHTQAASTVTDANANNYTNIGSLSSGATQQSINDAINTRLASIGNIDLITLVDSLPTASASTMNKLYLKPEATSATYDNYEVYITVRTGTSGSYSYAWEKVDIARIDLSGYSTTSHTHGNISSDGKVGTASGKPLITTTGGAVTTGAFGSNSGQFAEGNHTHSSYTTTSDVASEISDFAAALAEAINPS